DSGRLDNAGEELCLIDNKGMVVDMVFYDDHFPWPTEPDGKGPSLELKDPFLDNNIASSWRAGEIAGGTPGKDTYTGTEKWYKTPAGNELFSTWPNPFNFRVYFKYSLTDECRVSIRVFNSFGQEVDLLTDAVQKPGIHEINWTPINLPTGIYIVHFSSDNFMQIKKILYVNGL
ncbi:MAG TPA: T9SS type A sorting domain-containing protein, partial [Bacteroidales bacterium]|nr:T9SS type A sorting domain-containing protein [Bacteroidales bacterium]